jgi:hypothetical protein
MAWYLAREGKLACQGKESFGCLEEGREVSTLACMSGKAGRQRAYQERKEERWRAYQGTEEGNGVLSQRREACMPGEGEFRVPAGTEREVSSLTCLSGKAGRQRAYQERKKERRRACQRMEVGNGVLLSQGREAGMPGKESLE